MQWPPTAQTVEQARSGDAQAFDVLYRSARPRLRAFLTFQGFSPSTEDELAADIISTVFAKLNTLRKPQAFEAWFWTVARNRVRAHFRSQRQARAKVEPVSPEPVPPDEAAVLQEEHHAIRSALSQLKPHDRELLWLREVEELSYREIGGLLGTAVGTIRVRCHRARQRLEAAYTYETTDLTLRPPPHRVPDQKESGEPPSNT